MEWYYIGIWWLPFAFCAGTLYEHWQNWRKIKYMLEQPDKKAVK